MNPATVSAISAALSAELDALKLAHEALIAERQALIEVAAEALEQAIAAKNNALDVLAGCRMQRETLVGGANLSGLFADLPTTAEVIAAQHTIEELQRLGIECQQLNQSNGRLIGGLRDSTEGALGILRAGDASVTLYGEEGQRDSNMGSRVLGTA